MPSLVASFFVLPYLSFAWITHSNSKMMLPSSLVRATNRVFQKDSTKLYQRLQFLSPHFATQTRLFGYKLGTPGNPPGDIFLENVQDVLPNIDFERLKSTASRIRTLIGYPTYDLTLYLVEDELMQETNRDTRGMDKPTDILSFQFHQHNEPGVLEDPDFDIPDFYTLGEILIDIPYVQRQCQEDQEYNTKNDGIADNDDYEDRGVSGAMATVYDPEERVNMLLVHGMLHLVGYDHEDDDEYELMVAKEEEILHELGMLSSKD